MFKSCVVAQDVWNYLGWHWLSGDASPLTEQICSEFRRKKQEHLEVLLWGCWALWNERNLRVWEGKSSSLQQFTTRARAFVEGWKQVNERAIEGRSKQDGRSGIAVWSSPKEGVWKLNVDAAVRKNICGFGWCVRDHGGGFLAGAASKWPGSLTPLMAKLASIREALGWLKEVGGTSVVLESDSMGAISEILDGSSSSAAGLLRDDINNLAKSFTHIPFSHIRRSTNKPAHLLARAACSLSDSQFWHYSHPSFI
ncbi:unnamed protein product, partial [Cuscuta epithymum]